jgi:hypothetical protein
MLGCDRRNGAPSPPTLAPIEPGLDYHSFANVDQFRVTHLELDLRVDLEEQDHQRHGRAGDQAAGSARDAAGARHPGPDHQ